MHGVLQASLYTQYLLEYSIAHDRVNDPEGFDHGPQNGPVSLKCGAALGFGLEIVRACQGAANTSDI